MEERFPRILPAFRNVQGPVSVVQSSIRTRILTNANARSLHLWPPKLTHLDRCETCTPSLCVPYTSPATSPAWSTNEPLTDADALALSFIKSRLDPEIFTGSCTCTCTCTCICIHFCFQRRCSQINSAHTSTTSKIERATTQGQRRGRISRQDEHILLHHHIQSILPHSMTSR